MFQKINKLMFKYFHKFKKIDLEKCGCNYKNYLQCQLDRSILKANSGTKFQNIEFAHRVSEFVYDKNCKVLCVGCRLGEEIDIFHNIGMKNVIGVFAHLKVIH